MMVETQCFCERSIYSLSSPPTPWR